MRRILRSRVGRTPIAVTAIIALALAVGLSVGWMAVKTPEQMAREDVAEAQRNEVTEQVDRVLKELWLMEAAEREPRRGIR